MIKLFSLKEEKAKEAATNGAAASKVPPGLIRMQKGAPCQAEPAHAPRSP